jgi:predicted AAA+ superfamily ATPase
LHYYAPRKALIAGAFTQLVGENPSEGGHYITVWAPRQTGKTWVMQEILFQLKKNRASKEPIRLFPFSFKVE